MNSLYIHGKCAGPCVPVAVCLLFTGVTGAENLKVSSPAADEVIAKMIQRDSSARLLR